MNWLKQNKTELLFIIVTGFLVNVFLYIDLQGFFIAFWDTDDFMRLVRIREFFIDHDLLNNTIQRSNVPFGCELHWTRLYDFFLIIPSCLLNFFTDSIENAVEYVGFCITPIFKCAASVIIYAVFLKCMQKYDAFLIAIFFVGNMEIMPLGIFGRPDHHMFIIFLIVLYLQSVQRAISENDQSKISSAEKEKKFYYVALTSFMCVWASPETLIPLLLTDFVLFSHFFFSKNIKNLQLLFRKNILTALFMGLTELITVRTGALYLMCTDILLISALLFVDREKNNIILAALLICIILFSKNIFPVDYDRISIVHIVLYAIGGIFFRTAAYVGGDFKKRLLSAVIFAAFFGMIFLILYPKFIYGMSADVSDYVKKIWLDKVSEMKSPLNDDFRYVFLTYCIMVFSAIFYELFMLKFKKYAIFWHVISINAFFYTIFSGLAFRMWPFSDLFAIPIIVNSVMHAKKLQKIPRIGKAFLLLSVLTLLPPLFHDDNRNEFKNLNEKNLKNIQNSFFERKLYEEISKIVPPDSVILADIDLGPEILYYTSCRVVGAPYHRQTEGIVTCYEVLEKEYDENLIRKILKQTHASYILFKKPAEKSQGKNLKNMIADDNLPKWVKILKLQSSDKMILAKINRKAF